MSAIDVEQPPPGDPRWERLAATVRSRRDSLGLTQADLTERGGPSVPTIRQVERASVRGRLTRGTVDAFDRCLRWERGSFDKVMNGKGDPVTDDTAPFEVNVSSDQLEALIRRSVEVRNERTVRLSESAWSNLADIANERNQSILDALETLIDDAH